MTTPKPNDEAVDVTPVEAIEPLPEAVLADVPTGAGFTPYEATQQAVDAGVTEGEPTDAPVAEEAPPARTSHRFYTGDEWKAEQEKAKAKDKK